MFNLAKKLFSVLLLTTVVGCAELAIPTPGGSSTSSEPASTAPTTAAVSSGAIDAQTYKLAAEDVLDIYVWQEDDLKRQVVVRPDGGISFPLAGEVQAAGRTVKELEAVLTSRIRKYITEAVVSVTVQKVAGYRVYVTGKVNNPGEFVLGSYVNVVQALTLADGVTPFAKKRDIKVVRRDATGREQIFRFNYAEVEQGRRMEQNITLQAGDTIIVP